MYYWKFKNDCNKKKLQIFVSDLIFRLEKLS